uniref:Uncharacterized protein n=1 Tax=Arundo donax TaxID=35708 RepID=A0A0A9GVJ5_ARUDO
MLNNCSKSINRTFLSYTYIYVLFNPFVFFPFIC